MSTFYLDYEGGNDSNDGTTFANRWKTFTSGATAARIAPNDTIRIMGSPAPTSLSVNGTFTNKSATVTLASALNVLVSNCDAAWTGSGNVTTTADSTVRRNGSNSSKNIVAGAFGTGLAAFFATGTLDLSAYQGLTFWIRTDAIVAAGSLSIRLCSDTAGVTTVNNIAVPTVATATANGWYPVYVDTAGALGASIKSVALYVDTDLGASAVTVYLDDISTVKAAGNDALNLQSLIGTNAAGDTWYAIRGISGVTVTLDESPAMTVTNTARGYATPIGTSTPQTVTAYKRETIKMATGSTQHTVQDSGTLGGGLITFSGGWDRTDMSTQTLDTWYDGCQALSTVITMASKNFVKFTLISCVRGLHGLSATATSDNLNILDGHFNNNATNGLFLVATVPVIGTVFCFSNGTNGYGDAASTTNTSGTITSITASSNRSNGIVAQGFRHGRIQTIVANNNAAAGFTVSNGIGASNNYLRIDSLTANDNGTNGAILGGTNKTCGAWDIRAISCADNTSQGISLAGLDGGVSIIGSLTTSGNGTAGITFTGASSIGDMFVRKSSISEATKITEASQGGTSGQTGSLRFQNYLGTVDNVLSYIHGTAGKITTELGSGRHTASGVAWTMAPVNTIITVDDPLRMVLARLAVASGTLVTVTAYFLRSSTSITPALVITNSQGAGGPSTEQRSTMTVGAATWEQLTVTWTPAAAGVVEIEAQCYGGSTLTCTIDDMTFAQA